MIDFKILTGKTILITGGAGYIAAGIIRDLLQAQVAVVIYDCSIRDLDEVRSMEKVVIVEGNLNNKALLINVLRHNRVDAVVHLAAYIMAGESMRFPAKYAVNNILYTQILLEAMIAAGVLKLVFASSAGVYSGDEAKGGLIDETMPVNPKNAYGMTKYAMELMMEEYSRQGISFVAFRFFNAAGAFEWQGRWYGEKHEGQETHLIARAIESVLYPDQVDFKVNTDLKSQIAGLPDSDRTAVRDYIHIEDLANAHVRALAYLMAGGSNLTVNLGTGQGYSAREIANRIEQCVYERMRIRVSFESGDWREGDPAVLRSSSRKAWDCLGWKPEHSDLDNIISSALSYHSWAKEHGRRDLNKEAPEEMFDLSEAQCMELFRERLMNSDAVTKEIKVELILRLLIFTLNRRVSDRIYHSMENDIYDDFQELSESKKGFICEVLKHSVLWDRIGAYKQMIKSASSLMYRQRELFIESINSCKDLCKRN